jgi:hypothetical protein
MICDIGMTDNDLYWQKTMFIRGFPAVFARSKQIPGAQSGSGLCEQGLLDDHQIGQGEQGV